MMTGSDSTSHLIVNSSSVKACSKSATFINLMTLDKAKIWILSKGNAIKRWLRHICSRSSTSCLTKSTNTHIMRIFKRSMTDTRERRPSKNKKMTISNHLLIQMLTKNRIRRDLANRWLNRALMQEWSKSFWIRQASSLRKTILLSRWRIYTSPIASLKDTMCMYA